MIPRLPRLLPPLGMVALLAACSSGPPEGIPSSPGTIDAESLPDLVTAGTPDLPLMLWLTTTQLTLQDWRACPQVFYNDDGGVSYKADDCVDSSGIRWFGSASWSWDAEDQRETVILRNFGADDGVGGWIADGRVQARYVESGTGYLLETDVNLTSIVDDKETLFWVDVDSAYTWYNGILYADRNQGDIGVQGWGTAEVSIRNTPVAFLIDCEYAAHFAGSMSFSAANDAFVNFHTGSPVSLPPPADTGDTADTGPIDTAGTTDTDTDTGGDTDTSPLGDDDDIPDGACGNCSDGAIGSTDLAECVELSHKLTWPFPPPW